MKLETVEMTKYCKMTFEIDATNIVGEGESIVSATDKLVRDDDTDVSATNLSGTLTISANKVVTRTVENLEEKRRYQLQVQITVNGRVYTYVIEIYCADIYG